MTFTLCLALITLLRAADLVMTYVITPNLRFELNPFVRWLGWRWNIVANVIVCPIAAWEHAAFFWMLCGFSIAAAIWNARVIRRIFKKT